MPFDGSSHSDIHAALPFTREDYFDLVDKTGRIIREDKRGFIPAELPTATQKLVLTHYDCFTKVYRQFHSK